MSLHPYSYNVGSESDERVGVAYRLAIGSVVITGAIYWIYESFAPDTDDAKKAGWFFGYIISTPTALGLFGFLYKAVCSRGWRKERLRSILSITVPDLNGTWKGKSKTHYPNRECHERPARLVIWQDMRHIGLCIDTPLHKIDSVGASVRRVADGWVVSFHYLALRKLKRQEDWRPPEGVEFQIIELEKGASESEANRDLLNHHTHVGCARLYIPDPERWPMDEPCEFVKIQFYTDNMRLGFMEFKRVDTEVSMRLNSSTSKPA